MPTNRLIFLIFFIVLAGSLLYLNYRPGGPAPATVKPSPKQYIERVETGRAADGHPGTQPAAR